MGLIDDPHQEELRAAGWRSRGFLPHFDGLAIPQFITFHLADSIPRPVIERWRKELQIASAKQKKIILQRRIERYLDYGYGEPFLRLPEIAKMVQESLLKFDGIRYRLSAWGGDAESCSFFNDPL